MVILTGTGRAWWLRIWTRQGDIATPNSLHGHTYAISIHQTALSAASDPETAERKSDLALYLGIYIAISAATAIMGTLRYWWNYVISIKASRVLFAKILSTIIRMPLRWVDTVPVGRILNRFTADFNMIDTRLSTDIAMVFSGLLSLIGIFVAALFVSPLVILLAVVLCSAAVIIARMYVNAARSTKRLESASKSPVFETFNAALAGLSTIRGFQKTQIYFDRMCANLDRWNTTAIHIFLFGRWQALRISLISMVFEVTVSIFIVLSPNIDAALAGFTLSFALDFSTAILFAIRAYTALELDMNCTERVIEYSELKTETQEGETPPAAWPTSGNIDVNNLVVSYAEGLDPVLKDVSFSVRDNERIGVVGRTGAGKSSLTLALFRFLEPRSGNVTIDGIDISKVKLHSLRSRLAIIPQVSTMTPSPIGTAAGTFAELIN